MPTFALFYFTLISIVISDESPAADFSELGKELLGGFVVALVLAVAYTLIKLRMRDKQPAAAFISISSVKGPEEPAKSAHE